MLLNFICKKKTKKGLDMRSPFVVVATNPSIMPRESGLQGDIKKVKILKIWEGRERWTRYMYLNEFYNLFVKWVMLSGDTLCGEHIWVMTNL